MFVVEAVWAEGVVAVDEPDEVEIVAQRDAAPTPGFVGRRRDPEDDADAVHVGHEPDEVAGLVFATLGQASVPGLLAVAGDHAPDLIVPAKDRRGRRLACRGRA
jgi:hypothetical protein